MRVERELTLDDLAKSTGIDRPTLSRAERGYHRLTAGQIERVADALDVTPSEYRAAIDELWDAPTAANRRREIP